MSFRAAAIGFLPFGDLARVGRRAVGEAVEEGVEASARTADDAARAIEEHRGVYFFGEDVLPYIDRPNATLGQTGNPHFFMPLEDAAHINSVGDAARASGNARSITEAYRTDGRGFGVSFPLRNSPVRTPTAEDANGYAHFFGGGRTAVRTPDPNGGFLLNNTREFVTPGGIQMPRGTVLFEIGENGTQVPVRRF